MTPIPGDHPSWIASANLSPTAISRVVIIRYTVQQGRWRVDVEAPNIDAAADAFARCLYGSRASAGRLTRHADDSGDFHAFVPDDALGSVPRGDPFHVGPCDGLGHPPPARR
jgi:hypothetical protein